MPRFEDIIEYILKPEKNLFRLTKLGGSRASTHVDNGIKSGIKAVIKSLDAQVRREKQLTKLFQSYYGELRNAKLRWMWRLTEVCDRESCSSGRQKVLRQTCAHDASATVQSRPGSSTERVLQEMEMIQELRSRLSG